MIKTKSGRKRTIFYKMEEQERVINCNSKSVSYLNKKVRDCVFYFSVLWILGILLPVTTAGKLRNISLFCCKFVLLAIHLFLGTYIIVCDISDIF